MKNDLIKNYLNKFKFLFLFSFYPILFSCNLQNSSQIVEVSEYVREKAYSYAEKYIGMNYEWGGQDLLSRGIDCSGLVINCYAYALENTDYSLLFTDTTAKNLFEVYTFCIYNPKRGDLIFMGKENSNEVSHVGLVNKVLENNVSFIDSTISENPPINGVSQREYLLSNKKIKSFGRLWVYKTK